MTFDLLAKASVPVAALALWLCEPLPAQAQGSMGGSIGVQEKSVSGDRDPPRAAPPSSAAPEPKRAAPPRRPANYDGVWQVTNIGCGGVPGTAIVSGGRISGGGVTGSVSSTGKVRTATAVSVGWGQISGNRASGGFRTQDGCTGRWTAVRR
ncbi:hypothetical protein [Pseudorhodoplanes sp.]|uniref:hypothetical protein n=1 Tax=Pseudorhodoplanes sp. TaxID=1934341 RepID=UPI00391C3088